jgi:hypothetical protein
VPVVAATGSQLQAATLVLTEAATCAGVESRLVVIPCIHLQLRLIDEVQFIVSNGVRYVAQNRISALMARIKLWFVRYMWSAQDSGLMNRRHGLP